MTDHWEDWEDWENEKFSVPIFNSSPNAEQLRIIAERKLIEESDAALTKDLFNDEEKIYEKKEINIQNKKIKPIKKVSNKELNEKKLKELSRKIRDFKNKKQKEIELYGVSENDDEYAEYETKFD
jgi:hypothetical protein